MVMADERPRRRRGAMQDSEGSHFTRAGSAADHGWDRGERDPFRGGDAMREEAYRGSPPSRGGSYDGGRSSATGEDFGGEYSGSHRDFSHARDDQPFHPNAYGDFNRGDYLRPRGDEAPIAPRQSFRGRGPKGYQRSDERIREDVCERLERDHAVDATDIEVAVENGVVTLTGFVDDRRTKRYTEDLVEDVGGVRDVQNQLRIARGR
jgi:hypothetical protein